MQVKWPQFLFFMLSLMSSIPTKAATTLPLSFPQTVQSAQMIFEGVVIKKQVGVAPYRAPFTYVTFKIVDVIKGQYIRPTITLRYMGGDLGNGQALLISDMDIPKVGEHGIYFVESMNQLMVNPIVGWQQGHYLVVPGPAGMGQVVRRVDAPSNGLALPASLNGFKQKIRGVMGGGQKK